jgi:hypothetical protein
MSAVAYSCGAIRRHGETINHDHDPAEWKLCRRLAGEAARLMDGVEVGMGSSAIDSFFAPFFVVANKMSETTIPSPVDEAAIRVAFGGCLHPNVRVLVEPLRARGEWWTRVREQLVDNDDAQEDDELMDEGQAELERWKQMIHWFRDHCEIRVPSVVLIDAEGRPRKGWTCCNFPCMILGATKAGSLVGVWGYRVDR